MVSVREDNCPVLVNDGPVIDMEADAASQGITFAITSQAHEVLGFVEVLHAFDFLLDNRAAIQLSGDVVTGCPDEFHSSLESLLVRVGPDECGQE